MTRFKTLMCVTILALTAGAVAQVTVPATKPAMVETLANGPVESLPGQVNPQAEEALDKTFVDISGGATIQKVAAYLAAETKLNMVFRWPALQSMGIDKDSPIHTSAAHITARTALRLLTRDLGNGSEFAFVVDGSQVIFTTRDELRAQYKVVRVYDIGYLMADFETGSQTKEEAVESLRNMLMSAVDRDTWDELGGNGTARVLHDKLIVTQSYDVIPHLDSLMESLRKRPATTIAVYDVNDLLKYAPPPDALGHGRQEEIINAIETTCGRDTWRDHGGRSSSIAAVDGKLMVTAPPAVQEQIESLLAMMRQKH